MGDSHERIGEYLIRIGALTPEQVEAVLEEQEAGDPDMFGLIAIRNGFVTDEALDGFLAEHERAESETSILTQLDARAFTIEVIGPLNSAAAGELQRAIDEALASNCPEVHLQFEHLHGISSICIGKLLLMQAALIRTGRTARIVDLGVAVRRVFELVGIQKLIPVNQS